MRPLKLFTPPYFRLSGFLLSAASTGRQFPYRGIDQGRAPRKEEPMWYRHQDARRAARTLVLLTIIALTPAGAPRRAFAIAGKGGKMEFAIDAPWRLEPSLNGAGQSSYGSIPIQISIHDAL